MSEKGKRRLDNTIAGGLLIGLAAAALIVLGSGQGGLTGLRIRVEEEDGSPSRNTSRVKFGNGTVTANADGSMTIANSGGAGPTGPTGPTGATGATGAGGAPSDATYITQTANGSLSAEQAINGLSNGILKHASGVFSTAVAGTDYATVAGTETFTNKTIDGGDSGTGTTRASGSNIIRNRTHNTDCTAITDGKQGEQCIDEDDGKVWGCVPSAGDCDTAGEWKRVDASGGGGGGDYDWKATLLDPANSMDYVVLVTTATATVNSMRCWCDAGSATLTWKECNADCASCGTINALTTCNATSQLDSSMTDGSIAANACVRLAVSSLSGTPAQCHSTLDITGGF